jgi:hypothetical protein
MCPDREGSSTGPRARVLALRSYDRARRNEPVRLLGASIPRLLRHLHGDPLQELDLQLQASNLAPKLIEFATERGIGSAGACDPNRRSAIVDNVPATDRRRAHVKVEGHVRHGPAALSHQANRS